MLVIGFASGTVPPIPANHLMVKNVSVHGVNYGGYLRFAPEVLTASLGETSGEEAVYEMIALDAGRFEFENCEVDVEPQITTKTSMLLMEGFRRIDEQHRGDIEDAEEIEDAEAIEDAIDLEETAETNKPRPAEEA